MGLSVHGLLSGGCVPPFQQLEQHERADETIAYKHAEPSTRASGSWRSWRDHRGACRWGARLHTQSMNEFGLTIQVHTRAPWGRIAEPASVPRGAAEVTHTTMIQQRKQADTQRSRARKQHEHRGTLLQTADDSARRPQSAVPACETHLPQAPSDVACRASISHTE